MAAKEAIPISFTIIDPDSTVTWTFGEQPTRQSVSPVSGSAGSAGPFQVTAQFTSFGSEGGDIRTGGMYIQMSNSTTGCSFPIYGHR